MVGAHVRKLALVPAAALLLALGGCALKHPTADLANGKILFVKNCAACHTLAHADANGIVGPNLDDAFRQDRADGVKSTSIQGLVDYWVRYPNSEGVMPQNCSGHGSFCLSGQEVQDVAAYVSVVAAIPGQDTGALAEAVPTVAEKPAVEKDGVVEINADPTGQLKFLAPSATATPGKVTLRMQNMSSVMHDIAIKGNGVSAIGPIVSNGGVSTVSVTLPPGTYQFYCSVDGHAAAGMRGPLVVK